MTRKDPQLNLRLPAELKEKLEQAAEGNSRSVTAETVERLRGSFSEQENMPGALFLIARQEMRAAQAEVDVLVGKASIAALAWALKEAMTRFDAAQLESDTALAERYKSWDDHLTRIKADVFDYESNEQEFDRDVKEKLEALRKAYEQSRKVFHVVSKVAPKATATKSAK